MMMILEVARHLVKDLTLVCFSIYIRHAIWLITEKFRTACKFYYYRTWYLLSRYTFKIIIDPSFLPVLETLLTEHFFFNVHTNNIIVVIIIFLHIYYVFNRFQTAHTTRTHSIRYFLFYCIGKHLKLLKYLCIRLGNLYLYYSIFSFLLCSILKILAYNE